MYIDLLLGGMAEQPQNNCMSGLNATTKKEERWALRVVSNKLLRGCLHSFKRKREQKPETL